MRLDAGGDLVQPPLAQTARTESAETAASEPKSTHAEADPRVGSNVRLGDDPAALPPSMRAQAEPHIARSPVNAEYLIGTFQEGRYTNGSAVNCGYSVSEDGGFTWTRALIPNLTPSSGGPYPRATDPVAGVALSGNSYLNTLSAGSQSGGGTLLVSRSIDGRTFGSPRVAYQASPQDFPDKNWMAINNFAGTPTAGRIVVTFTMFPAVGDGPTPIMRVYSDNGGETWSSAAFVHSSNKNVQGSQPVFLRDGRLAIVYWNFNGTDSFADDFMELVVSDNGGVSFGAPKFITAVNFYDNPSVRDGGFLPSATTDATTGNLYLTYQARYDGQPRIMFTRSSDAGTTWTVPVPISDNPSGSGVFNAAISASPDGQKLAVAFYDHRNNPGSTTRIDLYVAMSFDGGGTWQPNVRVSSVSTDATLAPLTASGYMLGDYQGIAAAAAAVPAVPLWIDTRTGNPDPFTARVNVVPLPSVKADLTSDGRSDLIWQNNNTGARAIWVMNGPVQAAERFLPTVATEWQIATSADFNADGHTDLVWQNQSTGARAIWLMNGSAHIGERFLPTIPTEWQIAASGDFSGDGQADLLWQNSQTGARAIWLMNGSSYAGERFLPPVSTDWQIAGADEFNGDGQLDILWENVVTGQRAVWLMNGTVHTGERFLPTVGTQWRIAGTGEFNGDAHADIVWQNTVTGERAVWGMNGTAHIGEYFLPTIPTEWEIRNH